MTKILLVGCGYWGKNWYKTIMNSKYELVGVVDPSPIINVEVPLFKSMDDVDIKYTHIIVATNAELHKDFYIYDNVEVLIEKPCGTNIDEARNLHWTFPGYLFLYSNEYNYIKNNLSKIGKPLYWKSIRASMGPRVRSDVSIIEDYMIHDLYMFLDLFGTSFISDVKVSNEFKSPIQSSSCNLSLFTNDGVRGDFYSSWIYPDKERKIVIVGDDGSFIWEGESLYYDSTKWVGDKVEEGYREIIEPVVLKSNLELELEFFILGQYPDINCVDVWKLLTQIKNKL
tara:strand:- start:1365 stop:2216 length:852 start_codon:yes stop_codon:yes gene_type:complete